MKKSALVLLLLFSGLAVYSQQQTANGYVYDDANGNGRKDRREAGIPNVAVSNGADVALTDNKGRYTLPVSDGNAVFVIKPGGYQIPVDEDFIPRFYYHHKLPLAKSIDFALRKEEEPDSFTVVVFGDPQPYSIRDMDYFTQKIVYDVKKTDRMLFGITLGDIAGDDLSLHPVYKERMRHLQLPWYNVMGNHDMNQDALSDELSDETFKKNFGSANYAFNYGKAHFIVLDNILYPDPRDGKGYWGGYRDDQFRFLENDLKLVPKDRLVVLSQHIHMKDGSGALYRQEDRQRLFDLLKEYENVLILSAHTHLQEQLEYTKADGWKGKKPLHEYNVATTTGDWYSGKLDEKGLPDATMRDGTPQGYALLNINGNQYDVDYKVAGRESNHQMNIFAPKVVPHQKKTTAQIMVNFFIGGRGDLLEYRVDEGKWRKMSHVAAPDLNYLVKLLEWDFAEELLPGRRPSNPVNSAHVWIAPVPADLPAGRHTIEVRATDRYGKTHFGKRTYSVLE
jgi:3',5'-cyclic AMP phosphodiesterase CpdA